MSIFFVWRCPTLTTTMWSPTNEFGCSQVRSQTRSVALSVLRRLTRLIPSRNPLRDCARNFALRVRFECAGTPIAHRRSLFSAEISFQKTFESGSVAGFVFCHLVYCVVNGIVSQLFRFFSQFQLAFAGSTFCSCSKLKVLLS